MPSTISVWPERRRKSPRRPRATTPHTDKHTRAKAQKPPAILPSHTPKAATAQPPVSSSNDFLSKFPIIITCLFVTHNNRQPSFEKKILRQPTFRLQIHKINGCLQNKLKDFTDKKNKKPQAINHGQSPRHKLGPQPLFEMMKDPKAGSGQVASSTMPPGPAFQRATDGPAPPPPPTTRVLVVMRVMYCCMMAFSSRSIAACSLTRPTRLCSSSRSVRKR